MFSQNSVSALATELDKLSRIMGNKNVRTTFNGSGAYTDGHTVNVPAMDMDAQLDPTHQAIMRGYHIHEVSHVTDTDFGVFNKRGVKKIKDTWNCCEDVFVERKAMEKFPGARRSLQQTINHVLEKENEHWAANPEKDEKRREKWWTEIPYAALQVARRKMGYDSEALDQYIDDMPKELMREARKFSTKMIDADNSHDALAVARAIERRMNKLGEEYVEEEEEKQKKLRQSGDDDTGNSADEQDHEDQVNTANDEGEDDAVVENPSEDGDGDDDGNDDGDDGNGTNGGGDGEDGDGGAGGSGGEDEDGDADTGTNAQPVTIDPTEGGFSTADADERAKGAMNAVFGKYSSKDAQHVCTDKAEVFDDHKQVWAWLFDVANRTDNGKRVHGHIKGNIQGHRTTPLGSTHLTTRNNTKIMNERMPDDVRLYSARLARLLLSQEDRRKEGGHRSGKIDARRLSQIKAGNTNVFARNSVTKTAETRIMVAVDGSSSMQWEPTVSAILALNQCLGRANVKFDIVEWSGVSWGHQDRVFGDRPWLVYHKKASDNWRKINTGFEFQPVGGDTPTYSSMVGTARIMSEWQEPRRVLLFLTDGKPNGREDESKVVGDLVRDMCAGGIETYGVYIGRQLKENSVTRTLLDMMFDDKWTECTFEKLGETLLGGIERLLIKGGHAHAA